MIKCYFVVCLLIVGTYSTAQFRNAKVVRQNYVNSYDILAKALDGQRKLSFKDAVLLVESTYFNHELDTLQLNQSVKLLAELCNTFRAGNSLEYSQKDLLNVSKWASIFKVLTDTVAQIASDGRLYFHLPFTYDFEDFLGEQDWSKMFVVKLLTTHSGNCHSLPYLYKILAEELGTTANLALAPNHIYIKHKSLKTGMYNTELTSATFPIDAWIMASGYIHLTAVQNKVYMKALDDKESIALCVIDLAEGYKRKTNNSDPDFILKCCDKALEYFPNYVNAIILKAETIKSQYDNLTKANPHPTNEIMEQAQKMFKEMQDLYVKVHKLGYRQMPKDMYLKWLLELKTEKEKYLNKNVSSFDKK